MQTAVYPKSLEDTMYYRNIPVFIYNIKYPVFSTSCSATSAQAVNEYYIKRSRKTEAYCRTVLYPQAVESARYIQDGRPFHSYMLDADYKVTYNKGCITSLYMDTYTYMGGAHGETVRTSDTWDFKTGARLQLKDIYPIADVSLHKLRSCMEQRIAERLKVSPGSYFENYSILLSDAFHRDRFYLTPEGFTLYYQQYDVAPYSTGIPEFRFAMQIK